MSEKRLRFGCHDFINSRPITSFISDGDVEAPFDAVFEPPSTLAEMLKNGELDMAIIPSIEYARIPGLKLVKGFSIASRGAVKTVILVSRKKLWDVETVVADRRSRTSVALLRILLKEHFHFDASIRDGRLKAPDEMLEKSDAALIIGDEAFDVNPETYNVVDLSSAWFAFTGKPFVFAVLCVREGVNPEAVAEAIKILEAGKENGMGRIEEICRRVCETKGLSEEVCLDYLSNKIRYDLDQDDLEGLNEFLGMAEKHNLIVAKPEMSFFEA